MRLSKAVRGQTRQKPNKTIYRRHTMRAIFALALPLIAAIGASGLMFTATLV